MSYVDELRFHCQKILPTVFEDSLSYLEVVTKVGNKLNEVILTLNDYIDYQGEMERIIHEETKFYIEQLKDEGYFVDLINDVLFTKKKDKSIQFEREEETRLKMGITNYSYDDMMNDVRYLNEAYSRYINVETLGTSVLGREIVGINMGNINAKDHLLVFTGHHAREHHMTPLILRMVEMYCENMEGIFYGEKLKDILKNVCFHFVPSINPDGLELCRIGISSIPRENPKYDYYVENISKAVEYKFKNTLEIGRDVTQLEYNELINEIGSLENYTFRNQDCHVWKANANGIDLHYNCWEENVNKDAIVSWYTNNKTKQSFASENFVGLEGFTDENKLLKKYIDKYNIKTYTISYHGKGPTSFWNYNLKGYQLRRNYKITDFLSEKSNTPYSEQINGNVGFSGYMLANGKNNYLTYSAIRETGWGNEKRTPNNYVDISSPLTVCPLPNKQLEWIWESEKFIPLYMTYYMIRKDLKTRDAEMLTYDLVNDYTTSDKTRPVSAYALNSLASQTNYTIIRLSEIGATADSTILDIIKLMPNRSTFMLWVNDTNRGIRNELPTELKTGTIIINKTPNHSMVKYYPYNASIEYVRSVSFISNTYSESAWSMNGIYSMLSQLASTGSSTIGQIMSKLKPREKFVLYVTNSDGLATQLPSGEQTKSGNLEFNRGSANVGYVEFQPYNRSYYWRKTVNFISGTNEIEWVKIGG